MARHLTLLSVLLAFIVTLTNATDWCKITCPEDYGNSIRNYVHTMCKYKHNRAAPRCNRVVKQGLDESDINIILNYHNQIRRSAANLPPLVWDEDLATVAQRWANQCDYKNHDQCRDLEQGSTGQNMATSWKSSGDVDLKDIMKIWANEKKFVNINILLSFRNPLNGVIGHYTQMIWRKTTKIGCGFVKFSERKFLMGRNWDGYNNFLVCNYGERGNMFGQPVY